MKTLFKQPFPMLVATIVTTATLVACSNEMNPTNVSDGEPQAIAVRFATPSAGQAAAESPWQENDQVMVTPEAESAASPITFGYTEQEDGTYAWQNILEGGDNYFKVILPASFSAYFPGTDGTNYSTFTLPNISEDGETWQADQSDAAKLHAADYMTSLITTVASGENTLNLTLEHRLSRLTFVVTEYGNEFDDVPKLGDVKIKSQKRGVSLFYRDDEVSVIGTGEPVWISPFTDTNASDQPTYTAIVTPWVLTSGETELMSLTVNGTSLRVKYKGDLTELTSGSAYTFHLKVGKDYVTVMESDVTEWTGTETDVTSYDVFTDLKMGDYYYSDGNTSDGGLRKLYSDGTFEMENIKPDLKDGRTVLGIVMKVGRDVDGNWADTDVYMQKDGKTPMSTIRGYVLALKDGSNGTWKWGSYGEKTGTNTEQNTGFYGYMNTNTIKAVATQNSKDLETAFPATYYATEEYEETNSAPNNTSGWFLPSAGQCRYWFDHNAVLLESIKKATANNGYSWKDDYWSSSENSTYPNNRIWCLSFPNGGIVNDKKSTKDYYNYVRSILVF